MTATDLKKRAIALAEKTKIDSVTPEEVGQLSNDIVEYIENVEINGSSLGIRKTYTSVSAMEADSTAPKDDKGVLLRRGMLVNIYNQEDPDSADNGKVFSFQNPGWAFRGTVDAGYATKEELTELDNITIKRTEDAIHIDVYLKEFYINTQENVQSVRIVKFYKNVLEKNQVDILVNGTQNVSLNGSNQDNLLKSSDGKYLCIVDYSNFIDYNIQGDLLLDIARNIELQPSLKSYLLDIPNKEAQQTTKNLNEKLYGSGDTIINETKDISSADAAFYIPYNFTLGQVISVRLSFTAPLTSNNVLICTTSQHSLVDEARMDILHNGSISDKSELEYSFSVTKEAKYFTLYTAQAAQNVNVVLTNIGGQIDNIYNEIKEIKEKETGIDEAPTDGKTYGRKNKNWVPIEEGSSITNLYFINDKWKSNEIVAVGVGKTYNNLYDAMQYAKTKATKDYIVEVQLYSDIAMFDDSQLHQSDLYPGSEQYWCICNVPPFVRLRGIGSKKTISLFSSGTYTSSIVETLHVDGNSILENLNVIGKNVRYPIHFERGNNEPNKNSITRLYNVDITHLGVQSGWSSPEAWGSGNAEGQIVEMYGCRFIAPFDTVFVHNWNELKLPIGYKLYNCYLVNNGEQKVALHIQDNGSSKQVYQFELIGNKIHGYLKLTAVQSYKLIKPNITGQGNTPFYLLNELDMENVRIKTNEKGGNSYIIEKTNIGDAIFGKPICKIAEQGREAYITWDNNLSSLSGNEGTLLGKRLGNCISSNKTMVLNINGEDISIIFNQDYTNMSNQEVVDDINTKLNGKAVAEVFMPLYNYYVELTDVLSYVKANTSVSKGMFVDRFGNLANGNNYEGFSIDEDADSGTIIRIISNCIVSKSDQFAPLFVDGSETFIAGDRFTVENGKLKKDTNGKCIALDDDKILVE